MSQKYSYVKIPYHFFEGDTTVTPEELYLYLKLTQRKLACDDCTYTNIDILSQETNYYSREDRNKKKVRDILISLIDKGVIEINVDLQEMIRKSLLDKTDKDYEKFDYSKLLIVNFPFLNLNKKEGNFVIIGFSEYEKRNNPNEFFAYAYIKKWGKLGCKKSFDEWKELLDVKSDRTVKDLLYKMNSDNTINIDSGKFTIVSEDKIIQETNTYTITPNGEEAIKHNTREKDKVYGFKSIEDCNWFNNENVDEEDFILYLILKDADINSLTSREKETIVAAETKINRISKNQSGKKVMTYLRKKAEQYIDNLEQKQTKRNQQQSIKKAEDLIKQYNLPVVKTTYEDCFVVQDIDLFSINVLKGIYYVYEHDIGEDFPAVEYRYYPINNVDEDKIREFLRNKTKITLEDIQELKDSLQKVMVFKQNYSNNVDHITDYQRRKQKEMQRYSDIASL